MSDKILVTIADDIATVRFNRPAVLNALDEEMVLALRMQFEALEHDAKVRCVVVCGEGAAFCAGGDVGMFVDHLDHLPELSLRLARELHFAVLALKRMPKPVLASVHGAVAGAGFSLMLACDLAIAADDARFTSAYSRIGASPDGGSTFFLTRALGSRKALELTLLSEPVDAAAALALGLVNRLASPERLRDETRALAARLAAGPTVAYAEAKRLVGSAIDNSLEQQLEAEAHAFSRCTRTDDLREGVTAFARKRPAMFRGK